MWVQSPLGHVVQSKAQGPNHKEGLQGHGGLGGTLTSFRMGTRGQWASFVVCQSYGVLSVHIYFLQI